MQNNFQAMYDSQILERKNFKYPPFYRLIKLTLKHKDADLINEASKLLAIKLREIFEKRVLGPEFPIVSRIKNFYLKNILLKFEKEASIISMKSMLSEQIKIFNQIEKYKSVRVVVDVDPI